MGFLKTVLGKGCEKEIGVDGFSKGKNTTQGVLKQQGYSETNDGMWQKGDTAIRVESVIKTPTSVKVIEILDITLINGNSN